MFADRIVTKSLRTHRPMESSRSTKTTLALLLAVCVTTVFVSGCVSKSAAQAQARLAYLAGKQDAITQMNQQAQSGTVTFIGPVEHSVVPWTEGLTLAQAILAAVYTSPTDPIMITIRRASEEMIQVTPERLLSGDDFPLKPGDVIQFYMPNQQFKVPSSRPPYGN